MSRELELIHPVNEKHINLYIFSLYMLGSSCYKFNISIGKDNYFYKVGSWLAKKDGFECVSVYMFARLKRKVLHSIRSLDINTEIWVHLAEMFQIKQNLHQN